MPIFSPTRPHWAKLVIEPLCPDICGSVVLRHRETPTSGGHLDLWLMIAFVILVCDDTIFKKGGEEGNALDGWSGSKLHSTMHVL